MNGLVNTKTLIAELDRRIQFHIHNKIDPHNIGNAVITSLRETKEAIAAACNEIPGAVPVMLIKQDLEDLAQACRSWPFPDRQGERLVRLRKRLEIISKEIKP
jgi:hypothetical protein